MKTIVVLIFPAILFISCGKKDNVKQKICRPSDQKLSYSIEGSLHSSYNYNYFYSEDKLIKIVCSDLNEVKTYYYSGNLLTRINKIVTSSSPKLETYRLYYNSDNTLNAVAIGFDTSSAVSTDTLIKYYYNSIQQLVQIKSGINDIVADLAYSDKNISTIHSSRNVNDVTNQKHTYFSFLNPFKDRKFLDGWYTLPENTALWFSENALKSREIWHNGDLYETHKYSYKFENDKLTEFVDSILILNAKSERKMNYINYCE